MVAVTPKSEQWLQRYYSSIGGSNAGTVLNHNRFKTPSALWDDMRGVIAENSLPYRPREIGDDMRRGIVFEDIARDLMAEKVGHIDEHDQDDFVTSPDFPFAHCLPDGWLKNGIPVEIKVPRPAIVIKINTKGILPGWYDQCQHTLAITKTDHMYIGILDVYTAIIHHYQVVRDEDYIANMMKAESEFYRSVLEGKRPDFVEPETDFFDDEGKPTTLETDEAREIAEAWFRAKDLADDASEAKKMLAEQIKELSQNAQRVHVPSVGYFNNSPVAGRKTFNSDLALKEIKRLAKIAGEEIDDEQFFKVGRPSRRFSGRKEQ